MDFPVSCGDDGGGAEGKRGIISYKTPCFSNLVVLLRLSQQQMSFVKNFGAERSCSVVAMQKVKDCKN